MGGMSVAMARHVYLSILYIETVCVFVNGTVSFVILAGFNVFTSLSVCAQQGKTLM